jgi:hypothetical protein
MQRRETAERVSAVRFDPGSSAHSPFVRLAPGEKKRKKRREIPKCGKEKKNTRVEKSFSFPSLSLKTKEIEVTKKTPFDKFGTVFRQLWCNNVA